ncbi:RNA polymerase sigma-70 factor (ECF subfamily) [Kibdelosporangium phytohabitans]|nr:RNA polymerase sigma-70 factor (ECF subfamily) [Kibdelosporangium phytohabitans]
MSFEEIAPIVDRTPSAARKLASRARRQVRGAAPAPDPDLATQRRVVNAFLTAARGGDLDGLPAILDPDAVLRVDSGSVQVIRGAAAVAGQAGNFQRMATVATARPALVNGAAGLVNNTIGGDLVSIISFTITGERIAAVDILADHARLTRPMPC